MSSEINPSTDSNMDELIKQVKKTIKEHKNSKFRMDEKMYGSIYTSISHWGLPLSERLWNSWLKHTEIHPLTSKISYEIDYESKRLNFRYDRKNPRLLSSSRSTLTIHI